MRFNKPAFVLALAGAFVGGSIAARTVRARETEKAVLTSGTAEARDLAHREKQIRAYSHALEVDPQSAIALGQLAGLYLQRARETGEDGDYLRAEEFAKRSLALRVNRNSKSYVTLATAYMAEHKFAEAESTALLAVQYDPAIPQYRALLGEAQLELGDYVGARESFNSLGTYRGNLSIAPRLARWAELQGDTDAALRLLRKSVAAADSRREIPTEQRAWFHYRLGDLELRNGRFRRARSEFEKGLKIEPADYRILSAMAKLALLSGKPDDAISYGQRALATKLDPATLGILGDAYLAKGDTAAARENLVTMEVAVQGQPGAYHRAWSLFLLDHEMRFEEVQRNAATELVVRKDIYGYDVLAWSNYRLGQYDQAAYHMRRALQLGTRDPVLFYHAGMIENSLGHRREARKFLAAALKINSRFDLRQAAIAKATLDSLAEMGEAE